MQKTRQQANDKVHVLLPKNNSSTMALWNTSTSWILVLIGYFMTYKHFALPLTTLFYSSHLNCKLRTKTHIICLNKNRYLRRSAKENSLWDFKKWFSACGLNQPFLASSVLATEAECLFCMQGLTPNWNWISHPSWLGNNKQSVSEKTEHLRK